MEGEKVEALTMAGHVAKFERMVCTLVMTECSGDMKVQRRPLNTL